MHQITYFTITNDLINYNNDVKFSVIESWQLFFPDLVDT
jgi:hypothetical protein